MTATATRPTAAPVPAADRGPNIHSINPLQRHTGLRTVLRPAAAPSTTRQSRILNTAIIGNPGNERGIAIGEDQLSGAAVFHDQFVAYQDKLISSPNVCVLGGLGVAKSSLIKISYVLRPLMLLDRRAVVVDKKPLGTDGDGEYSDLTRVFGAEPFTMLPGDYSGTAINLHDPIVLTGGSAASALTLLTSVAESLGPPLSTFEHAALRVAQDLLRRDAYYMKRAPVNADFLRQFVKVVGAKEFQGRRPATLDLIDAASLVVQERFQRLEAPDLDGMFNRETSKHVTLHPKLTTFNISNLPESGPATAVTIAVVNAWLIGILRRERGSYKTTLVAEEAWNLLAVAEGLRANAKLARSLGLSLVSAIHHISDVPPGSPGMAMIKEASTIHLFRQEQQDDIDDCVHTFGLDPRAAELLGTLPQGENLMKIGQAKPVHLKAPRTESEVALTETDEAMR